VVSEYRGVAADAEAAEMADEGPAPTAPADPRKSATVTGEDYTLRDGSVVIASITSCTNTSNPYVMIGAGLVARKARALGLTRKPWVKTSLAPGSQVVSAYLEAAELQDDLDAIGFNLVGYGCTTCIGNSGPLQEEISKAINDNDLIATSVHLARCARELPRFAALGGGLCAGRRHEYRHYQRPDRADAGRE